MWERSRAKANDWEVRKWAMHERKTELVFGYHILLLLLLLLLRANACQRTTLSMYSLLANAVSGRNS